MFVSGKEEMKFNLNIHIQADDKTTLRGVGFVLTKTARR